MKVLSTISSATVNCLCDETVVVCLKLYLLLYADDTILLAENKLDLQNGLSAMYDYFKLWDLNVNEDKTKIVVLCSRKSRNPNLNFTYNGKQLTTVESFAYLGVLFNFNGKFVKAKKKLVDKARRAMFFVFKKLEN
jgi:hypothetical protein